VQPFLQGFFYSRVPTIGVSATVTTGSKKGEEFDFISSNLGLDEEGFESLVVESPFDPKNFLLVVPDAFPSPKDRDRHTSQVAIAIEDVVNGIGGRTMGLFTSYRALGEARRYLEGRLCNTTVLVQGDIPKMKVIEKFRASKNALILATSSFWQGVDIQGEDLSCVVIDKLPFAVPTDPVLQYLDRVSGGGFSTFFKYSIPKAVIALKQGSGRLIRSEADYGAVVLCDNRVTKSNYGSRFDSAFPDGRWQSDEVMDAVHFIRKRAEKGGESDSGDRVPGKGRKRRRR
jgi:ATP-dependent DNA helicase DinG